MPSQLLLDAQRDFHFITPDVAVGSMESRSHNGFVAVITILASQPWDEIGNASAVPTQPDGSETPVLHINHNDGEGPGQMLYGDGRDLADRLDEATAFIELHRQSGPVLVHCAAGMSRSPTVVCAWLMRYQEMSWEAALQLVKSKRLNASPMNELADAVHRWWRRSRCKGVVPGTFIVCGEGDYQYCSDACIQYARCVGG